MALLPLENRDDLYIGLYIKIEGSWFSHPFSKNTFKIKFEKDLATLRGLKKVKLFYDPTLSDPKPSEDSTIDESTTRQEKGPEHMETEEDNPSFEETPFSSVAEDISTPVLKLEETAESRQEAFTARRKQLKKADQAYQGVLQQSKLMFRELRNGHSKAMARASDMVEALGKIIGDSTSSMALMNLMSSSEEVEDFFMHSLNVCALSIMLAQVFTQDVDELQHIGMGALFHDLGLLESERKSDGPKAYRTTLNSKALRKHPHDGRKMAERFFGISTPCLEIIAQHHERLDGSGYPSGYSGEEICLSAKIVMIVDEYDELCNHPDITKSLTPYESLCYLYAKRRGPLWDEAVVALVQMLSVYPPGSLVELSDETIGIVSSINPQSRMAPCIMLYSAELPREEARILDLSQEDGLSIVKSLQPKDIPYEIREFLNPRRIISYFPSQSEQAKTPSPESLFSTQSTNA